MENAMERSFKEEVKTNADFKKVIEMMIAFRNEEYLWWQAAEYTFDTFMIRSRTRS
jgi:TRAP-type mannitol/chloroaromatic compound transport system substrate-binding protein